MVAALLSMFSLYAGSTRNKYRYEFYFIYAAWKRADEQLEAVILVETPQELCIVRQNYEMITFLRINDNGHVQSSQVSRTTRAFLRPTVVCETKWNEMKWDETKWKSAVCETKICSPRNENLQFAKWGEFSV